MTKSKCVHKTYGTVFRFREYLIHGKVCGKCGERFFNKEDLDRVPSDELTNFLTEVKYDPKLPRRK